MIRLLRVDEVERILPMAERFFAEAKEPGVFYPAFFCAFWRECIAGSQGGIFIEELDVEGKRVISAMFGFFVAPYFATGDTELDECFWYADPQYPGAGVRVFKQAMHTAKYVIGAKVMYIHHTAHLTPDKIDKLYQRQGFNLCFYRYAKEL